MIDDLERAMLAEAGWVETTVGEMFDLSESEVELIDFRLALAREVRRRREELGVSQAKLAERLGVAQPRIPGVEAAGRGTSTDAILSAYFALGGTLASLAGLFPQESKTVRGIAGGIGMAKAKAKNKTRTKAETIGEAIGEDVGRTAGELVGLRRAAAAKIATPQARPAAKVKRVDKPTGRPAKPAAPEIVGGPGREAKKRKATKI